MNISSNVQFAAKAAVLAVGIGLAVLHDLTPELVVLLSVSLGALGVTNSAAILAQAGGIASALGPPPGALAAALAGPRSVPPPPPPPPKASLAQLAVFMSMFLAVGVIAGVIHCTPAERREAKTVTAATLRDACAVQESPVGSLEPPVDMIVADDVCKAIARYEAAAADAGADH